MGKAVAERVVDVNGVMRRCVVKLDSYRLFLLTVVLYHYSDVVPHLYHNTVIRGGPNSAK